jgi:hypothetical protein
MSEADHQSYSAGITAIIYVSGTDSKELDDAERSCREYAGRFGWRVLKAIRDNAPGKLLAKAARPGTDIILTGSPDMISLDQNTRDHLVMTLERAGCIVHPLGAL